MNHKKKILFERRNYIILIFSIFVISLGYFIMSGGGSQNPLIFNNEIYNFKRIRLAPLLVILGFALALFSIIFGKRKL
ncbi:MAG: hypothetical protein CBD60_03440 [Flavobacteriaceae bacterium TMED200]|nr:hypothetical protein [Flavobacteriaceae bacterium]OUW65664.1 MAG: hypothetical protein CBD60_03440 [Flavobacteriaceae bacterium TMED200]